MLLLSNRMMTAGDDLVVSSARTLSSGTGNPVSFPVTLGQEHPFRRLYVLVGARTNSTTGPRRFTNIRMVIGGVIYPGSIVLQNSSSDVHHPQAMWRINVPVGASGTLQVYISGDSTGVVSFGGEVYIAKGRFVEGNGTTTGSVASINGPPGVIMHLARNANGDFMSVPSYTTTDHYLDLNGLDTCAGRIVTTATTTTTIVTPNATSSLALLLTNG